MAQSLPHLKTLELLSNYIMLSEQSVLALARHCPRMSECMIDAIVDIRALVAAASPGMFSRLEMLQVKDFSPPVALQDRTKTAIDISRVAPCLWSLSARIASVNNMGLEDEFDMVCADFSK